EDRRSRLRPDGVARDRSGGTASGAREQGEEVPDAAGAREEHHVSLPGRARLVSPAGPTTDRGMNPMPAAAALGIRLIWVGDTLVGWRAITWFNARLKYTDVLPIRASAYILSIVNEQVSKGAIALYLSRREGIPGWEVGSSMLFIMFCEYYYLLGWATIGVALEWDRFPNVFHLIPWLALASAAFFVLFHLFFTGRLGSGI